MLVLSPLVTAASASAPTAPARSRSSRSKPEPTMRGPVPVLQAAKGLGVLVHDGHRVALGHRGKWPGRNRLGHIPPRSRARHSTTRDAPLCKGGSPSRLAVFLLRWRRGAQLRSPAPGSVVGPGGRQHPRAPPLPPEEQAARAAAGDRAAELGAPGPARPPSACWRPTASRRRPTAPRRC